MKTKNGSDLSVEEITSGNYYVPAGEERLYHVKIEVKQFNPKTGKKISVPAIQKFGSKVFRSIVERNLRRLGYTIEILHDPSLWLQENAKKHAQNVEAKRVEQEKAQQAKKEAEKAALKAEILAELREAGIIPQDTEKKGPGRPKKEE